MLQTRDTLASWAKGLSFPDSLASRRLVFPGPWLVFDDWFQGVMQCWRWNHGSPDHQLQNRTHTATFTQGGGGRWLEHLVIDNGWYIQKMSLTKLWKTIFIFIRFEVQQRIMLNRNVLNDIGKLKPLNPMYTKQQNMRTLVNTFRFQVKNPVALSSACIQICMVAFPWTEARWLTVASCQWSLSKGSVYFKIWADVNNSYFCWNKKQLC